MSFLCGADINSILSNEKLLLGLSSVFWGYANFVLVGYFKDVEADRATGYNTLPVVFGRRTAAVVSNIFGLLMVVSCSFIFFSFTNQSIFSQNLLAFIIFLFGTILMLLCQLLVHSIKSDDESSKAINLSVHAFIVLLSSITLLNKPEWLILIIIFYLLFNLTIYLRPSKTQI
jgi:4-hydroxybenzoate polyprenyltransferase